MFKKHKGHIPKDATNLISKLLVYKPDQRLKPLEVLQQAFFDELRNEKTKLPNGKDIYSLQQEMFEFTDEEIGSVPPDVIKNLKPQWYKKKEL